MSSLVIGVACEDNGHFFAVSRLVDAALLAQHTWLDGILEQCRSWRREGMEQVVSGLHWPFTIVLATPQPEVEAWAVSGFVPKDAAEQELLKDLRAKLSVDPTTQSERLTSHPNHLDTDAKAVLSELCQRNAERQEKCLADRALLRQRGAANGLAAFLAEVDQHIVPALL